MKKRLLSLMLMVITVTLPTTLLAQATAGDEAAEPYAVLSDNNTVLTFYYDDQKAARGGIAIGSYGPANYEPWYENRTTLTIAVFDESFANDTTLTSTAYWFHECIKLTEIKGLEYLKTDKVTDMRNMFYGCSKLTTLDVSHLKTDNVTNMNLMFYYCSGLTSLDVKGFNTENVTDMGSMFNNCSGLKSLDISSFKTEKVKNMIQMFYQCYNLTTIYVGNGWSTASVTADYGYHMFTDCTALVGGMGTTYDENHVDFTYAHIDEGPSNPGYLTEKLDYNDGDLFTAETVEGIMLKYRVISEADKTCQVGTMVDTDSWISSDIANAVDDPMVEGTITIPEYAKGYRVIKIGYEAFINCTQVTSIVIPNTVTEITTAAMAQSGLTAITIPSSVSSIHYDFLHNCSNLESIVVEEGNQVYDSRNSCNALIETATNKLMMGCKTSTVPNGIETIGTAAFILCKGLTAIELPNTVTRIETQAFNSSDLSSINLPPSLEYIGYSCFAGSNVTSFVIPANVKEIMLGAFNCNGLTSIVVEQGNQVYDSRDNCNAIIETATNTLFEGFSVTVIPNSVTTIGSSAFREVWDLHEITIPESVAAIGEHAFIHTYLEKVTSERPEPVEIPDNAFSDNCYEQATLYVPQSSIEAYSTTGGWKNFKSILAIVEGGTAEPYAVLSEDSLTVTFYYDDQKTSRGGMDINNSILDNSNSPYGTATSAVFDVSFDAYRPTSTACWFENCSSLATINGIEYLHTDDVTNMSWMFECCFNLEELDLSNFNTSNVTEMYGMFLSCQGLKSLNVSSFNTSKVVGMNQMFCGLSNLTNLDLSNFDTSNVRWMYAMFADCPNLTSLDISSFNSALVSNMGDLFSNCVKLKTIYVGDGWATTGVEENGDHVFDNCPSLVGGMGTVYDANRTDYTYAHIDGGVSNPGYLTDINGSTLNDGETFTAVNSDGIELRYRVISAADKTCQVGDKADSNTLSPDDIASAVDTTVVGIINVPEQANGYKVVRVGYQAFVNCRNVTEVVLPNTVTELYLYSFAYSGIKRFTLPRSVSIIHYAALTETDSLETIIVDSENPVFDSRNNCNAIIETASNTLVRGCITSFVPDGITAIGSGAFLSCCAHDWTIELPNSVTRIETQAFNSCDLTDIKLSNNLQYVGYSAFGGSKLTSVVIPASVTEMGIGAFRVNSLTSLVVDEANSVFDSRDNCNAIIETATNTLVCGSNVTIIPNSVTAIGRYAFSELWNLKTITLPSSITRIDDHAFWYSNLDTIISLIEKPFEISDNVFREDVYKRCALNVPAGTVDAYRSTSGWNLFQNIVEMTPSYVSTFSADGVLTISNEMPMTDALEAVGGRAEVAKTITAIVWNNTFPLTNSDLQGLDNPNKLIYVNSSELAPANRDNVVIGDFAKNIVLTDVESGNNNFYCPQAFTAEMISYTHEYRQQTEIGVARGWETIALPFTVQTIMHEKWGGIVPFGNSNSGANFWLRQMTSNGLQRATKIEANVPYIISMPNNETYDAPNNLAGRVTFSSQDALVPMTEYTSVHMAVENGMLMFVPCFQTTQAHDMIYALNVGETRGNHPEGSVFEANYRDVRPFEAFTVHEGGNKPAPQFILVFDLNEAGFTGIENVRSHMCDGRSDVWYDLNGRRLQQKPTQKGVYLNNRCKVIIR